MFHSLNEPDCFLDLNILSKDTVVFIQVATPIKLYPQFPVDFFHKSRSSSLEYLLSFA